MSGHTWLPGNTQILVGQYGAGHRLTGNGPACGSREQTKRSTVNAAQSHDIPPCTTCWAGEQPW